MEYQHVSVMLNETIRLLVTDPDGCYIDCTLGGGGHSRAIADRLTPHGRLIAIDQDPDAVANGRMKLAGTSCKVDIVQANFADLVSVLHQCGVEKVQGILFDLGVSSYQLDAPSRGFSYMHNAPLDMRMNPAQELSAAVVVNTYSQQQLQEIIRQYGEERWAARIAQSIVARRMREPLTTTGELVDVIKAAIPAKARREGPHPAKRTFQAIRIEVNNELGILRQAFLDAIDCLQPGGRLAVITFHSLEDRICKQVIKESAQGCICYPAPVCICHHKAVVKIVARMLRPSSDEIAANPRSRSAKLRVAEKI